MENLKRTVEIVFSPMGVMTLLFLGGTVLALTRRHSQWGRRFLLTGAALFLAFTFSPLAEILIRNLESDYPPLLVPPASIPIRRIVVLSAYGEDHPGIPVTSDLSSRKRRQRFQSERERDAQHRHWLLHRGQPHAQ